MVFFFFSFFLFLFSRQSQTTLSLATDGRFGVEPEVGGSSSRGSSGDVRESTGNPCYRNPPL